MHDNLCNSLRQPDDDSFHDVGVATVVDWFDIRSPLLLVVAAIIGV
jgi:hypothetical protein